MKQTNWQRLAPYGFYLSLLAAFVSLSLYIIQRQFNLTLQISLGFIVIGLALFTILDPGRVRTIFTGRQARYGSNALVMMLAFLGILIVVNFLIYSHSKRWDITQDRTHTLAPETLAALSKIPQPMVAMAFFTSQVNPANARTLLDDYSINSGGKFTYQFIDPNSDPISARNANVTVDGTVVLVMGQYSEKLSSVTEQDMTNAVIRLSNPGQRAVYFLTGHGELDLSGAADQAVSSVQKALEAKSYTVKQLNLLADQQIPADAQAVIIAGPDKPLTDNEVKLLQDFADKGGSLIVMEEPTLLTHIGENPDPLAAYLTQTWGITLDNDMIVDLSSNSSLLAVADTNAYGSHAITEKLKSMVTLFPTARSTSIKPVSGITQTELVKTSSNSWAEFNLADLSDQKVTFDQNTDMPGPIPLAVAAENTNSTSRIVVFGDRDFASDSNFTAYGNGDLIVNSIDWAAKQDKLINLTVKSTTQRVLVPPQKYTLGLIFLGSVVVLPGLVLFTGILVWIQRRRRG
jgi:ABC-type uncharacterized transport system involved in gliding motility auxiliary subunit